MASRRLRRLLRMGIASSLAILGVTTLAAAAHALSFNLTADHCTGGCGTGSTIFGTVSVVQGINGNTVNITDTLNSPSMFIATGSGVSLGFNITGNPAITISAVSTGFAEDGMHIMADGTGTFQYSVICSGVTNGCGPGAANPLPGPLSFSVSVASGGLTPASFIANSSGNFFISDIIGPTGNTGDVAATGPVPEPTTALLLASGVIGLAAAGTRRRS